MRICTKSVKWQLNLGWGNKRKNYIYPMESQFCKSKASIMLLLIAISMYSSMHLSYSLQMSIIRS